MADHHAFDACVYLPLADAITELKRRETLPDIDTYLATLLPFGVPAVMREKKSVAIFRHIATPNYEIRRFVALADLIRVSMHAETGIELHPLILEFLDDKFTNRNEWKYSLGRLYLYKGTDKKNAPIFESIYAVDFNTSNSKPIATLKTLWGQSLVDFHHELFASVFPSMRDSVFDLSGWLRKNGDDAKTYYKFFLSLFLKHGVLLENFLLDGTEGSFTKDIILPTLFEIERECGFKPLIVALESTEIEHSRFWLSHPCEETKQMLKKIGTDIPGI
jgi:hypothetical protein